MREVGPAGLKLVMGLSTRVSNFGLVLWLHLLLGSLEGGDLRLELVIVPFQHLLLSGGIFAIESCLLPVAI